jgi:hypothetical protein
MNNLEATQGSPPSWFIDLYSGKQVFGKRKDQWIREILDLGGLARLEEQCGFEFDCEASPESFDTDCGLLLSIRSDLECEIWESTKRFAEILGISTRGASCSHPKFSRLQRRITATLDRKNAIRLPRGSLYFNYNQDAASAAQALFGGHRRSP